MRIVSVIILLVVSSVINGQVYINEVMSSNSLISIDNYDEDAPDWIELFNASENSIDLSYWYLSDDKDVNTKWYFPNNTSIEPFSYLIIVANGDDHLDSAVLQANFKLKQTGERLSLYDQNLNKVDEVKLDCIQQNRSYGRNNAGEYVHFYVPSPGAVNIYSTAFDPRSNSIELSHAPGLYDGDFTLNVSSGDGSEIFYTTDGTLPEEGSQEVNSNFSMSSQFRDDGAAYIPSGPFWEEPQESVFQGYNFKFSTFDGGCPSSNLVAADYFVRPNITEHYPVPVYSITFDEREVFGDSGILVPGITGQNYEAKGKEWEREGHLQMFHPEDGLVIDQPILFEVKGTGSRKNSQKSLKLTARDLFGNSTFDYPIFSESDINEFRKIILRSGHSDFTQTLIKDLLASQIAGNLDLEYMQAETSVVFMNGEYWGIQNARESMDKYYLESHFGINPDSVEVIKFVGEQLVELEGTSDHFQSLMDYAQYNDLSNGMHYKWISNQIDISSFIDYHISELYFSNWDWPKNNNKVWRSTSGSGSKYRWMLYDCDACFYRYSLDRITDLDKAELDVKPSFILLKNLLKNDQFRNQFQSRYFELISTDFSSEALITKIDSIRELYDPLIFSHIKRWSTPESYFAWNENLSEMRNFALQRPVYAVNQLNRLFSSPVKLYPNPAQEGLTVDAGVDNQLFVQVMNTSGRLVIEQSIWSGEKLPLNDLPAGMYLINIQLGSLSFSEKFVKD